MMSLSREPRYKLNAICPYYTMFPLEFPIRILRRLPKDTVVVDPFCGRGTTNYAAQTLGIRSYGYDSSPIAAAIGSSIKYVFLAPAPNADSRIARLSTCVAPHGTQTKTRGLGRIK